MTILNCSATTCIYNKGEQCSKGEIKVNGADARNASETSCASFQERSADSVSNSCASGCGCEKIEIDCKACECAYNDHCKCTAASIDIAGAGACECQDTKCSSFQCR